MAVAGKAGRPAITTLLDKSGGRTKAEGGGRRRLFFVGLDERDVAPINAVRRTPDSTNHKHALTSLPRSKRQHGRRRLFFVGLDERDVGDYKTQ